MKFDISDQVKDSYEQWRSATLRWSQILAVGNGGGAVLMGGALKDAKGIWWLVGLPSTWLFVLGVATAGLTFFLASRETLETHRAYQVLHWANETDPDNDTLDASDTKKYHGHRKTAERFGSARSWLETISASCFTCAIFWPAAVLTLHPVLAG